MTSAVPRPQAPGQVRAWSLAAQHLRRGEAGRDAALGVLIDAGFSALEALRVVATILASQERQERPRRSRLRSG